MQGTFVGARAASGSPRQSCAILLFGYVAGFGMTTVNSAIAMKIATIQPYSVH
jgi:hypothetical protein